MPERRRRAAETLVASALLALALCASCGGSSASTSTPTPPLPTQLDLTAALLTQAELPSGWASLSSTPMHSLSATPCDAPTPDAQYETASAVFQRGGHGTRLTETLAAFHPGQATQWLTSFQQGPVCRWFDEPGPQGTPVATQVSAVPAPAVGDQAYGYRLTTTLAGSTYETDVVYIRSGDIIVEVAESGVEPVDRASLVTVVRQALHKLEATRP